MQKKPTVPRTLKGKVFLITGGAGFIGSHVADAIIKRGGKVVIVDNLTTGRKENLNPKAIFYKANIADEKKIDEIFKKYKPDYIYHFAYHVLVPKSIENPLLDMDALRGSINLLQAAKKYGIKKIIFSSSGFIYGNNPNLPLKETEPHERGAAPYAITKYAIEGYLHFYKKNFGIDYVIFRNAAVYGPRQITGAMAAYIRELKAGVPTEFYGVKTRDYVYIDDVVDANLRALSLLSSHPDPVFNLGRGSETHLIDLYLTLAKILGKKPQPVKLPPRPGEQDRYRVDIKKAIRDLGWKPQVKLEEGLRETLSYWKLI
ncbi:MAG TPA: NAD-dependent epimerase/dehydratase family protein [Candidatus Paceibacterota bacterium]|nr:NAD-dependent epimerase/dehydratase family protein [Candidatus Paceibacterota bacterium]